MPEYGPTLDELFDADRATDDGGRARRDDWIIAEGQLVLDPLTDKRRKRAEPTTAS